MVLNGAGENENMFEDDEADSGVSGPKINMTSALESFQASVASYQNANSSGDVLSSPAAPGNGQVA